MDADFSLMISHPTAMEIFTNPYDLLFKVGTNSGKWGFTISRGLTGTFKLLIDTSAFADTAEEATTRLHDVLMTLAESCTDHMANENLDGHAATASEHLNRELIDRIITVVRTYNQANTSGFTKQPA